MFFWHDLFLGDLLKGKKRLAEYLLEWASEREGILVRFAKRRPLLRKLFEGYKVQTLNRDECMGAFRNDLRDAREEVLIYSPFINDVEVKQFLKMAELKDALNRGVNIKIVTRPPSDERGRNILKEASKTGVEVYLREGFHEKVIVVDGRIAYVGSANILAWPSSSDLMQRVENSEVVKDILVKIALPKEEEVFQSEK